MYKGDKLEIKTSVESTLNSVFAEEADIRQEKFSEYIDVNFDTGFISDSEYDYNRIVFGAPGTGKSYLLNNGSSEG